MKVVVYFVICARVECFCIKIIKIGNIKFESKVNLDLYTFNDKM
jgi:hypothetical protein